MVDQYMQLGGPGSLQVECSYFMYTQYLRKTSCERLIKICHL